MPQREALFICHLDVVKCLPIGPLHNVVIVYGAVKVQRQACHNNAPAQGVKVTECKRSTAKSLGRGYAVRADSQDEDRRCLRSHGAEAFRIHISAWQPPAHDGVPATP